jgi:hypothetical protein
MAYKHIRDNEARDAIHKMVARGLNWSAIAWHLNNTRPTPQPPYGHKEWTPLLVRNVYDCARA